MAENEELVRRFTSIRASILGYLRILVGDPHLAEDLFQDISVIVLEKASTFDRAKDFGAWVRGIARNLARNALKKQQRLKLMPRPELLEALERAFLSASPEDTSRMTSRLDHLRTCMGRVGKEHRRLLELRYRSGASLKGIARQIGRSDGAVQVMLSRLRSFLLRCIELEERSFSHGR